MANDKGRGGKAPMHSDEVVMAAYEAYGPCEAARRLGYKNHASTILERVRRIKARGCTRSEQRAALAAATAEKEEAFRKIIADSQKAVIQDAGTRENPHHYRQGNSIQELFDNHSVVPENVTITGGRISEHGMVTNNKKTGEVTTHVLYAKSANIKPKNSSPKFPIITPASVPTKIIHAPAPHILHKVKYAVVLSDAQIGFLRNPKTLELTPTHDRRALEVARRIITDVGPSVGVGIGDWMDWPVFSRYTQHPEYFATCNQSIQEGHEWKAAMIAAAPVKCDWTEIGSNHGLRPEKFVLEHNMLAMGVERARMKDQDFQEEWGVFTEPYLLHYQQLGIKMSGQYPGGEYEFLPGFMAMHAPPKKGEFAADVVHGHLTPVTMNTTVIYSPKSRDVYHTYGIGGMMSLTANPDKKSIHASLVPSFSTRNNGAQSIMIVEYIDGKTPAHQPYVVHIRDGSAQFMGASYSVSSKDSIKLDGKRIQ